MNQKQNSFLHALLTESTILSAAKKAGISRSTAYKYLADSDFKLELNRARTECVNDAVRYLQGNLSNCSEELMKIISCDKTAPQVKINAINAVFLNCRLMIEHAEIEERLQQIETMLQESGTSWD